MDTTTPVLASHPLAGVIPPLKIADRCDRCGAQAFVVVQLTTDDASTLMFCGHHFHQHEAKIRALDPFAILDDRDKINAKPSVSGTPEDEL